MHIFISTDSVCTDNVGGKNNTFSWGACMGEELLVAVYRRKIMMVERPRKRKQGG